MSTTQPPDGLRSRDRQLAPFEWYATMRQEAPVRYDPQREVWDVFRYEDVDRVLTDHEVFSTEVDDDDQSLVSKTMARSDPPDHERLRGFVADQFTPGEMREFRPRIEDVADELLESLADANRIDIVDDIAYPFPVIVIAELLGIPAERRERFKAWSDAVITRPNEDTDAALEANQNRLERALREMGTYFSDLLTERADGDGDDLVTHAANTDTLSHEEKIGFCILLLVAGNVTTTNLITNAIWCFDEANVIDAVRTGTIDRKQAIEEVLRYRSPLQGNPRTTVKAVEMGGERIEPGETIMAWIGAANHDPAIFDAPAEFRPERSPNPHLAFGKGIHYCLGAPLARIEADVAINALLEQFEVLVPDPGGKTPLRTNRQRLHGLEELSCRVESDR